MNTRQKGARHLILKREKSPTDCNTEFKKNIVYIKNQLDNPTTIQKAEENNGSIMKEELVSNSITESVEIVSRENIKTEDQSKPKVLLHSSLLTGTYRHCNCKIFCT